MRDHPMIESLVKTGEPYGQKSREKCPVCGDECETIFERDGEPVGCDECVEATNARDWWS